MPSFMLVMLQDVPAVRDEDTTQAGIYASAAFSSLQSNSGNATIYSSNDGINYSVLDTIGTNADMGVATTQLLAGTGGYWDNANTVTVYMYEGQLTSVTETEVLNGSNRIWIGNELIAFQNATLIATGTYTLSKLLRALRVTPTDSHVVNERCLALIPDTTLFENVNLSLVGTKRYIKLIQSGQDLNDAPAYTIAFTGATLKQLPPVFVTGTRDGSNNLTINWIRRTRALVQVYNSYKPLLADQEQYVIEFYNSHDTGTPLVRTVTVTAATTYTYLATDQTTDGFGAGVSVVVVIYQINEQVGRGFPSRDEL
jgi:hypothetical protein